MKNTIGVGTVAGLTLMAGTAFAGETDIDLDEMVYSHVEDHCEKATARSAQSILDEQIGLAQLVSELETERHENFYGPVRDMLTDDLGVIAAVREALSDETIAQANEILSMSQEAQQKLQDNNVEFYGIAQDVQYEIRKTLENEVRDLISPELAEAGLEIIDGKIWKDGQETSITAQFVSPYYDEHSGRIHLSHTREGIHYNDHEHSSILVSAELISGALEVGYDESWRADNEGMRPVASLDEISDLLGQDISEIVGNISNQDLVTAFVDPRSYDSNVKERAERLEYIQQDYQELTQNCAAAVTNLKP